jgi:hypothetical protein
MEMKKNSHYTYSINDLDIVRGGSDHVKFVKFKDKLCIRWSLSGLWVDFQ